MESDLDINRIEIFLRDIEKNLSELEQYVSVPIEDFLSNSMRIKASFMCTLQIVEASVNIGLYILRKIFGEEARGYVDVFKRLGEKRVLSLKVSEGMQLARLRNLILHRYWEIDAKRFYEEARGSGLGIIKDSIEEVRDHVRRYRRA